MESKEKGLGDRQVSSLTFKNKTRYLILVLGIVCIICNHSNSISMNFTVICMNDVIESQKANSTELHWLETNSDISKVFSITPVGALVGLIPSVPLISRFGIRKVLSLYGMSSAVGTFLMPLAVANGLYTTLMCRFLQGIGSGIMLTSIGVISMAWSPHAELSTYVAVLSSAIQLSSVVTMPVSGVLCESSLGWRSIYYGQGTITCAMYILFFMFFRDDVHKHRHVSAKELNKITDGKGPVTKQAVPYAAICKDKTVLGIWASVLGGNAGFMCLMLFGPTYLNKVLHMEVRETGFANALPYVFAAGIKFAAGPLSDYSTCISEKLRVILFGAVSQAALAIGFVVMALTTNKLVAQTAYTLAIVLAGLNIVGVIKCAQLVARQHCHFVMAVISINASFCNLLLPIFMAVVCPENTPEQWSRFFLGIACMNVILNIPFPFVASSKAAPYTKPGWSASGKSDKVQPEEQSSNNTEDDKRHRQISITLDV